MMLRSFSLLIQQRDAITGARAAGPETLNHATCRMRFLIACFMKPRSLGFILLRSVAENLFFTRTFSKLWKRHPDMTFHFYTNGSLLADEKFADRFVALGNGLPCFSLEGFEERTDERRGKGAFAKVMKAMDNLRERGLSFGISCTATSQNYKEITSDEFVDAMVEKGAMLGWYFMYMPIGEIQILKSCSHRNSASTCGRGQQKSGTKNRSCLRISGMTARSLMAVWPEEEGMSI